MLVFLLGKFMGKVFFGQLRAAEMEVSDGEERFKFGAGDGRIRCQCWRQRVDTVSIHRGVWILRGFGGDFEPREAFDAILGGILDPQRPLALFEGGF